MSLRFEFTYELSWKATKEVLEALGIVDVRSPKATFKVAFSQGLIQKETTWLMMLKDRNMTTPVYKEEIAYEITQRIISDYLKNFQELLKKRQGGRFCLPIKLRYKSKLKESLKQKIF